MDTRLLVFAVLLIAVGASVDYAVVLIFGLILLVPAFLIPSKPAPQKKVGQKKEELKRLPPSTPLFPPVTPAPPTAMAAMEAPHMQMSAQPSASSALFPNAMFPTLSLMPKSPEAAGKPKQEVVGAHDELLDLGLLLVILKTLGG